MVAGHFVMIPLWAPPVRLVAHAMRLRGYGGGIEGETELVRLVQRVGALGARSSALLDPTARSHAEIVAAREREAAAAAAARARQAEEAAARSAVELAEAQAHYDAAEKERADAEAALTCGSADEQGQSYRSPCAGGGRSRQGGGGSRRTEGGSGSRDCGDSTSAPAGGGKGGRPQTSRRAPIGADSRSPSRTPRSGSKARRRRYWWKTAPPADRRPHWQAC